MLTLRVDSARASDCFCFTVQSSRAEVMPYDRNWLEPLFRECSNPLGHRGSKHKYIFAARIVAQAMEMLHNIAVTASSDIGDWISTGGSTIFKHENMV